MFWEIRVQGKRPKGRLRQTWEEGIENTVKEREIEWNVEKGINQDL